MSFRAARFFWFFVAYVGVSCGALVAQAPESSSSSSSRHIKRPVAVAEAGIDAGVVSNGVYRNKALAMSCKIPAGWVLRTEEMNVREQDSDVSSGDEKSSPQGAPFDSAQGRQGTTGDARPGRVLLAAFSRPPEAHGADVNASIVIAAESVAAYPGLKEAAQYFEPLTEVAKAQGFTVDEDPYEIALGAKVLVRGDFHKDVGTRVMRQSTLAFLSHGYAVSITVIGGTDDEVEDLVDGVEFVGK